MELQVIEEQGQRVLTTQQIAEVYKVDPKVVTNNFSRNKDKFSYGKHYIELRGEDLKAFKGSHQNDATLKFTSVLYLWTEKGAQMIAKTINTDEAWDAYENVVDTYYRVKAIAPSTPAELMLMFAQQFVEQEKRINDVENRVQKHEDKVVQITNYLTETPERAKVNRKIEELARTHCKGDKQEATNTLYAVIKDKCGFDVHKRVENKRKQIQNERIASGKSAYKSSTLKTKATGMDNLEEHNMLEETMEILIGLITREAGLEQ